MKHKITLLFILISNCMFSQVISKSEFNIIKYDVYTLINYLKQSDSEKVLSILNIENDTRLYSILKEKKNDLINSRRSKVYTFPSYKLTKNNNELELTIIISKIIKIDSIEKSEVYLVIKSIVGYNKDNVTTIFNKSTILYNYENILNWWTSQIKSYVKETSKINELYNYIPPPPIPIPININ